METSESGPCAAAAAALLEVSYGVVASRGVCYAALTVFFTTATAIATAIAIAIAIEAAIAIVTFIATAIAIVAGAIDNAPPMLALEAASHRSKTAPLLA